MKNPMKKKSWFPTSHQSLLKLFLKMDQTSRASKKSSNIIIKIY